MPKRNDIKKVLVIGSGPIVIGQAAEFDYSGTQACKALREEGIEVVLINSNPATIMTDLNMADQIYIEPITLETVSKILRRERPDGILPTLGGQTGLNMAFQLADSGILDELAIKLLGTSLSTIKTAEDRQLFKKAMEDIGEKVALSTTADSLEEALAFAEKHGFPIIVRPAYTLGGTGGGIAYDTKQLTDIVSRGLKSSIIHQVLLEQSVAGWKEIEFEVIRDSADNCVIVCAMENIDPVGIHTGDSIVVTPCQTLSQQEYQMLKAAAIKIIKALKIEGGCNIQFALNPQNSEYVVIEVNPRVSRSSALASKATGYPIARVASKIAIGLKLDEIQNPITGEKWASAEPSMDYIVVKVPRWPFDKFTNASRNLGTQMKATGEVMAIGSTFEEALLKAIDSLDSDLDYHIGMKKISQWSDEAILDSLKNPNDERIFVISEALKRGYSIEDISDITKIDPYFIEKLDNINKLSSEMEKQTLETIDKNLLYQCKRYGFSDNYIANLLNASEEAIVSLRKKYGLKPIYKTIDTPASQSKAVSSYYYSCYDAEEKDTSPSLNSKIVVLGSGPIRIGQGIEFDYCSVHSVNAIREMGFEAIIINSNPETVSTDYDTSDVLYFEPLTKECVIDIIEREKPLGVIVQFGGQTAINLAEPLAKAGVPILGTSVQDINRAEDREKFLQLLDKLNIAIPPGNTAFSAEQALSIAHSIGYPVLVRPSYVLGGRAMEIVYSDQELIEYMGAAIEVSNQHPVLIDKYIIGKEVEIDGISDGNTVVISGIMEHVERAGIHSGDSFAIYPTQTISPALKQEIVDTAIKIAKELCIKGLFNIQFVIDKNDKLYVLEVNPRASRTVPILSKVTGVPMVSLATKVMLGQSLSQLGYETGLIPEPHLVTVKGPVFSFSKLTAVDISLGPEMKSTGEVMGTDTSYVKALAKALIASGINIPLKGNILFSVAQRDKEETASIASKISDMGFKLYATKKTASHFLKKGIPVNSIEKKDAIKLIRDGHIDMVINTPTHGKEPHRDGFNIRRTCTEFNIPCITSLDTAKAIVKVLEYKDKEINIIPLQNYRNIARRTS